MELKSLRKSDCTILQDGRKLSTTVQSSPSGDVLVRAWVQSSDGAWNCLGQIDLSLDGVRVVSLTGAAGVVFCSLARLLNGRINCSFTKAAGGLTFQVPQEGQADAT